MAVFNPQDPQINIPNWENTSRPISDLPGDKSTGMALATAGEAIDSATTIADRAEKDYLKKGIEKKVTGFQDEWIEGLKQARNFQIGNANAVQPDESLITAEPDVPGNVKQGIARAQNLALAREQNGGSGKANDTLYAGKLYSYTKQLRAENPGYVDYIDEQIAKVSGKDPANYYMQNILQDINQANAKVKSEQDKDLSFIDKYVDSVPGADLARAKYLRGDMNGQQLREFIADKSALKINQQAAEAKRSALKSQNELTVMRVKQDFSKESGEVINDAFNTQRMATNTLLPKEIADYFTGQATGATPILSEEQNRSWLTNLAAQRDLASRQLRAIALRRDGAGDSYASNAGGLHNLKDEMTEQLAIYDNITQMVKDKDYQLVYFTLNQNNAINNRATQELYGDPSVGGLTQRMQAVTAAVGPQTGAILLKDAIINGVDTKYTNYVGGVKSAALAQADPNKRILMTDTIDDARRKGITDPGVYKSMIDIAKIISDPSVKNEGKVNAAIYAFDPKNITSLNKIAPEQRHEAFMTMTDPEVTKFMAGLPSKTQTEYRTWAEKSWGGIVARDALADLNKIKTPSTFNGYGVAWHSGEGKKPPFFELTTRNGAPLSEIERNYAVPAQEIMDRVNQGIGNMSNIERAVGGDVNAYVARVLANSGVDITNHVSGIPYQMMKALMNFGRANKPEIDPNVKTPVSR